MNPVRAGLVERPDEYPWSSARAHLRGRDDDLVKVGPLLERVPDWARFLRILDEPEMHHEFRRHQRTGRPMGSDAFVSELEKRVGRTLRPQIRGMRPDVAAQSRDVSRRLCPRY